MAVVDERILREAATKKGYNEGMQKGIEEGMQKGIKEGIKEGMQKGIKEGLYLVARNMKQMGLPIADITKATGLSEKEIAEL
jgi:predicted transposase/invertase (TIGR01784 family)